jgi:hypothetical protein
MKTTLLYRIFSTLFVLYSRDVINMDITAWHNANSDADSGS